MLWQEDDRENKELINKVNSLSYKEREKILNDFESEKKKARQRFFASVDEVDNYIPQCAVCKNVDGKNCKALKGTRPEKYYLDDHPEFQKCPHFELNRNAHTVDKYLELSKNYKW